MYGHSGNKVKKNYTKKKQYISNENIEKYRERQATNAQKTHRHPHTQAQTHTNTPTKLQLEKKLDGNNCKECGV